jgi:putative MATE family efflux protein
MDKKLCWKVLDLALPAIIANLLFTFQMIADTIMLGRYPPADVSLSALGLGSILYFMFFPLIMGLITGTVAIIARRWGAKEYKEARLVATDSLTILLLVSIPLALIGFLLGPTIIFYLGARDAVLTESTKYIWAVFAFYPFSVLAFSYQGSLMAAGDTKTPMYVNLITNSYNIIMNYFLIFGEFGFPELGVLGAGIATGTSYLVGAAVMLILHANNRLIVAPIYDLKFKTRIETLKKMFNIGIPAGVDMGMWSISSILMTPLILYFGTLGYSAYQIGLRAESIAYMPAIGFGIAATTLAGQYLGSKKENMAKEAVLTATKLGLILMLIIGAILIIFPRYISGFFTGDEEVIEVATLYLFITGFTEPFLGTTFTTAGGMRGAGYTRVPLVINFFGLIVLRLTLTYILAFVLGLGLLGIWLSFFIETATRSILLYLVFLKGNWMKVKV